jgi:choline dehydrogenase-like flavoprotein
MAQKTYDAIVIGTGAGGGMALKTLCEAGLSVCALNSGRRLDPAKDFRNHKQPYDMPYRGFGDPRKRDGYYHIENEYTEGLWEHGIAYTTAPGTKWEWPRCHAVGGKTNFWGRSAARMGDIDFKAAGLDGFDVDWPVTYADIAPFYSRVERLIGVASTVQHRPSNPDGEYLPPMKLRCLDYILQRGCDSVGIPYLPDRLAQLTVPHEGHPACHYCGNCTEGCDTGSFFSTPYFLLPPAEKTGRLDLRTNAVVRAILPGQGGQARAVSYVDRATKQEAEVQGRLIVVAASCVESARILLNSGCPQWPGGLGNSSGELGKNLCDHLYGTTANGYLPQLVGQPPRPDNVSASQVVWMPRWQNLENPTKETFIRGYSIYPTGGCVEFPWYHRFLGGFGSDLKRRLADYYPSPVSFYCQIPSLPSSTNFVDIDPEVKDAYGIPAARIHFQWGPNELLMWDHSRQASVDAITASGGKIWEVGREPNTPGWSLHETGTCRMGSDPKRSVTNAFGQVHDVPNVFVCDASVFLGCTDKTTTLSILAFALRSAEHAAGLMKRGDL